MQEYDRTHSLFISQRDNPAVPTIVHLDIPADDPERARRFYSALFQWTFSSPPDHPGYHLFTTSDGEGRPGVGGGLGKRGFPEQRIMHYIGVESIDGCLQNVERLGGRVTLPRMPVPGFGYLAHCLDTEGNPFGLFQEDPAAR